MQPVSSMIVVSVSPMPGTVLSRRYSGRKLTRSLSRLSNRFDLFSQRLADRAVGLQGQCYIGRKGNSSLCSAVNRLMTSLD